MGLETKKIIKIRSLTRPSAANERVRQPALQQEQQESGSNEVGISVFVDKDQVPWVFSSKENSLEIMLERVQAPASKFLDVRQGFSCCVRHERAPSIKESRPLSPKSRQLNVRRAVLA